MAVSISVQTADETERLAERSALVDELYELETWLEGSGAYEKLKRAAEIEKALKADADASWEDKRQVRQLEGTLAIATISAASCTREVVNPKLVQEMVGDDAFYAGIKVPVTFADKYLTEHQRQQVIVEKDGSRKITVKAR